MWASLILAVAKAIPAFRDIYLKSIELYYLELDRKLENESLKIKQEREALIASLKLDGLTAENRAVIRKRLYELSKQ